MKVNLLINSYGLKALAEGKELQHWHINGQGDYDGWTPPTDSLKVATYTIPDDQLPNRRQALLAAVNSLKERQQQVRAEAEQTYRELQTQINDLLMLGGPK